MKKEKIKLFDCVYDINYTEEPLSNTSEIFTFGTSDCITRTIDIATVDHNKKPLKPQIIEDTLYHEIAHAILTEGRYKETENEALVEWIGRNLKILNTQTLTIPKKIKIKNKQK